MFFWNSLLFPYLAHVGHLISGSSAFPKTSLSIWKFTVHVLLKPGLENFEHYFTSNKDLSSQSYSFSSSHVWMWELDYKEIWAPKKWCFLTVLLEETFESPLDCKEIKWVNPKGNQPWIFIRRTDAEAPILWPPDATNWLMRERLRTRRDRDDRGWDGWMASPTRWTWVWAISGS